MEGMARHVMVLSAVVTVASWGVSVAARAPGASTNDGVYTAAQAAKGQELYGQVCETCHQPAKFTGAEFTRAYVGRPLSEINHAMAEMPADNPGTLTSDDVAALIAYFLQMNKYPAGQTPLSGAPDALKSILISPRP
jgi:S-disulfanyl-L-cysteine oxidoreductase SoxD